MQDAENQAPLEVCIFNVGANVNFPLADTTERVFRKVWEMACYGGFLTGREAARLMMPRERGCIFFTDATASPQGGVAMPLSQVRNLVCVLSRKVRPES